MERGGGVTNHYRTPNRTITELHTKAFLLRFEVPYRTVPYRCQQGRQASVTTTLEEAGSKT